MDSEIRIVDCVKAALRDLGLPSRSHEEISNIIGLGLREAVSTLYPGADEELLHDIVNRYRLHYFDENRTPSQLFAGAREVIETLASRNYLLAVATGKGRKGLNMVLEATGLEEYFDATRCADETFSKPHPEMLEQILDELGVLPREALMIGDTEYDLQMAAHAGMPSLAVSYGVHAVERLLQHKPLDCLDIVTDIPPWLERHEQVSAVHG
jgi:phosphoglycolate phosphatase